MLAPNSFNQAAVILMFLSLASAIIVYKYDKVRSQWVFALNSQVLPQNSEGVIPKAGMKPKFCISDFAKVESKSYKIAKIGLLMGII